MNNNVTDLIITLSALALCSIYFIWLWRFSANYYKESQKIILRLQQIIQWQKLNAGNQNSQILSSILVLEHCIDNAVKNENYELAESCKQMIKNLYDMVETNIQSYEN